MESVVVENVDLWMEELKWDEGEGSEGRERGVSLVEMFRGGREGGGRW